jgi:drug/metabolite transporter (DMT)-like permease
LLLGSALSWAAGSLLSKRTSSDASSLSLSAIQLTAGGIALLFTSLAIGEFRGFSPGAVTAPSGAALVYLVVAGSVVGFAAYHWLLDNVPTTLVTTYTFVNPVVAVTLGWLFLQESLSPAMLIGGVMVVASVVSVWRAESRSPSDRKEAQRQSQKISLGRLYVEFLRVKGAAERREGGRA